MIETILSLEDQGFRFAPRPYGFDYMSPGPLTGEQSEAIIRLKREDKVVCRYLMDRAKNQIGESKKLLEGR